MNLHLAWNADKGIAINKVTAHSYFHLGAEVGEVRNQTAAHRPLLSSTTRQQRAAQPHALGPSLRDILVDHVAEVVLLDKIFSRAAVMDSMVSLAGPNWIVSLIGIADVRK
ncbi:MAG: hypothetical protein SEPTF4163_006566 [Sporothrix epigloea]